MAYRDLSTPAMVQITAPLVDQDKVRPLLESFPQTAGILGNLDAVHQSLITLQRQASQLEELFATLVEQMTKLDQTHDRKLRGTYMVLTGLAELVDKPSQGQLLIGLRDALFPNGLSDVNRTYREEAGNVVLLEQRLTDPIRQRLEALVLLDTNLLNEVQALITAGKALGDKLEDRRQVEAQLANDSEAISPAQLLAARNAWIRTVRLLESNLELSDA
ncbi:MAG: hypothetical protein AAFX99_32735, partial [Myxococcota bacterium]